MQHYLIVDFCVIAYIVGMVVSVYCMDRWRSKPIWYYRKRPGVEASWAEVIIFLTSWLGVGFQIVAVALHAQEVPVPTHENIP